MPRCVVQISRYKLHRNAVFVVVPSITGRRLGQSGRTIGRPRILAPIASQTLRLNSLYCIRRKIGKTFRRKPKSIGIFAANVGWQRFGGHYLAGVFAVDGITTADRLDFSPVGRKSRDLDLGAAQAIG